MSQSLFLFLLSVYIAAITCAKFKEEFTWTRINYQWPREQRFRHLLEQSAKASGIADFSFPGDINTDSKFTPSPENREVDYNHVNNIPMGANLWKDKLFITVPRRRQGVPSTLNYVSLSNPERHNVPLIPYPDWTTNQLDTQPDQRLVSVYRVAIDSCDRLWMIDTGIIEIPGNRTDLQSHSIVIIDLNTDKIIERYTLKDSDVRPATILALLTIDVTKDKCDQAYAYMPDLAGYGLIIFSLKERNSWRVTHNYFYLEPLRGDFHIGGQMFQWNDGIFSIALSDVDSEGHRNAYFHSMAGTNLYSVSTKILRNESLATRSFHGNDFVHLGDRFNNLLKQQTSASDIDKSTGVLFLNLVNENGVGCWNINKPFALENFALIQKDDAKMIYPCDIKVSNNRDLVVLTNNMPIFLYSALNYDEVNFRVWITSVQNAISGTKCEGRKNPGGYRRPGRPHGPHH